MQIRCPICNEFFSDVDNVNESLPHLEYWENEDEGTISCPSCECELRVVKHISYEFKNIRR